MAFKRVIIRRVGPLSWLLGTMKKSSVIAGVLISQFVLVTDSYASDMTGIGLVTLLAALCFALLALQLIAYTFIALKKYRTNNSKAGFVYFLVPLSTVFLLAASLQNFSPPVEVKNPGFAFTLPFLLWLVSHWAAGRIYGFYTR